MLSFNGNNHHNEKPSARSMSDGGGRQSRPADIPARRPRAKWVRVARRTEARSRPLAPIAPDELELELSRSRRFGHCFVLVRIPCAGFANREASSVEDIATAVSGLVRRVDRVWPDSANVYVLLPECERGMAAAMLARLHSELPDLLSADVQPAISWVVFPEDGFTKRALMGALERRSELRAETAPPVVRVSST
jgi:hypothetical protein